MPFRQSVGIAYDGMSDPIQDTQLSPTDEGLTIRWTVLDEAAADQECVARDQPPVLSGANARVIDDAVGDPYEMVEKTLPLAQWATVLRCLLAARGEYLTSADRPSMFGAAHWRDEQHSCESAIDRLAGPFLDALEAAQDRPEATEREYDELDRLRAFAWGHS